MLTLLYGQVLSGVNCCSRYCCRESIKIAQCESDVLKGTCSCRCFLKVKKAPVAQLSGALSPATSTFGSPGGKLQIMDPKKASNVEIVLKKFKMPSHCIADVRLFPQTALHAVLLATLLRLLSLFSSIL